MPDPMALTTYGVFLVLALVTLIQFVRQPSRARLEATAMFLIFAFIITASAIGPWLGPVHGLVVDVSFASLMAAPYLLLRLVAHLKPVPPSVQDAGLAGFLASAAALTVPPPPFPPWVLAVAVPYVAFATGYASMAFFRGAVASAGVTRWRMRFAATGSATLGAIIVLWGVSLAFPALRAILGSLGSFLSALMALAYFFAFAPPARLRRYWHMEEAHRFLASAGGATPEERSERALQALPEAAMRTTGGLAAAATLWDPNSGALRIHASEGLPAMSHAFDGGRGVAARALRDGRAVVAPLEEAGPGEAEIAQAVGAGAIAAVPFATSRRQRGVLVVFHWRVPLFATDDVTALEVLADQAALAIEHRHALAEIEGITRALAEREESFRNIARNADGVVVLDSENVVVYANPAAESLFGSPHGGLQGRPLSVPVAAGSKHEVRIHHPAKGNLVAEVRAVEGRWSGRRATVASFRDISERKSAEEALRRSEEQLRHIFRALPAYIATVDRDGRILFINRGDHGLEPAALTGSSLEALLGEEARPRIREALAKVFEAGASSTFEIDWVSPEGERRWYESHAAPLTREGKVVAATFVSLDVTERRRLESEAKQQREVVMRAERLAALGTLVAGVAHEVNNPLVYVRGNIETTLHLLEDIEADPEAVREDEDRGFRGVERRLRTAITGADRIGRIVRALRVVARQDTIARQRVDLNEVLRDVEDLVSLGTPDGVVLRFRVLPEPLPVWGNASEIHQAVLNLVKNAVDAVAPDGGAVTVETGLGGDRAEIVVTDNGPGIPDDVRARLFTPFFSTKPTGTGLGLTIVHAIANDHGGRVHLESAPGAGTVFTLEFPRMKAQAREPGAAAASGGPAFSFETPQEKSK